MKSSKIMGTLVASAFAGALASNMAFANKHEGAKGGDHYCSPGCKGQSECKGHGNTCKGHNDCGGKGWVKAKDEAECKGKGGAWTADVKEANEAKPAAPAKKKG